MGEIGGNKFLVESGTSRLFLDFGKSFGKEGEFYEMPFLQPRSEDQLVSLGILPDIPGIYKDDKEKFEIDGVVISHAHTDHVDSMRYLKEDYPVFTSETTRHLVMSREFCSNTSKKYRMANLSSSGRECYREFIDTGESPLSVGGFSLAQYPVDHSVQGACGTIVDDGESRLVYSGDIRFHGPRSEQSWAFVETAGDLDPDVLLLEGTNMQEGSMNDEEYVFERSKEVIDNHRLVLVGYPSMDLDRIGTFHRLAQESGRLLTISMKQAFTLLCLDRAGLGSGIDIGKDIAVFARDKKYRSAYEKEVEAEWPGEVLSADEANGRQEELILNFTLFDMNESLDVSPEPGAAYILSSSEPFNEEMEINYGKLCNWLSYLGIPLYQIHASGHARPHEMKQVVKRIGPRVVVPVHTECPELYARYLEGLDCDVHIPRYGEEFLM